MRDYFAKISDTKKQFICLSVCWGIFFILYMLSIYKWNRIYLFYWAARNHYLFIWTCLPFLIILKRYVIAIFITLVNLFGVIIGQFYGDFLFEREMRNITYDLEYSAPPPHKGAFIWFGLILLSVMVSIVYELYHRRKIAKQTKGAGA